jgi:excisionase family DNA binding protein
MAQKYYTSAETAKLLGKSVDEIKKMLERRELHGYRDGADWKFKVEDIDKLAKQSPATAAEEDGGDVLLSEVELGQSDPGLSGTVIGMNGGAQPTPESDIRLAESDLLLSDSQATAARLGDSAAAKTPPPRKPSVDSTSKTPLPKKPVDSTSKTPLPKKKTGDSTQFEELDLTLEEDLTLEDSSLLLEGKQAGSSVIDLGASDKSLDDDDLVLGGSGGGKGSSLAIGGDSGISLIDPSDSGLSLETPLNLGPAAEESLELGEADVLAGGSSPKVKADEEFLLTPLEEVGDAADSESGSQVIALDTEGEGSAVVGASAGASMAAMLDEDLSTQPALGIGATAPLTGMPVLGAQPVGLSEGAALATPSAALLEAPYTTGQIVSLVLCSLLLMLCGMMMFDLLRNMWSWSGIYSLNSSLMDTILGWIG